MVEGIKTPPKFYGLNFPIDDRVLTILWKPGCKGGDQIINVPDGDEDTWSKLITKEFMLMDSLCITSSLE